VVDSPGQAAFAEASAPRAGRGVGARDDHYPLIVPVDGSRFGPGEFTVKVDGKSRRVVSAQFIRVVVGVQTDEVIEKDVQYPPGYGYSGNRRVSASTSRFTVAATVASSGAASTRAMRSPMSSISVSRMPRVVTAGVPTRMPLATIGGF